MVSQGAAALRRIQAEFYGGFLRRDSIVVLSKIAQIGLQVLADGEVRASEISGGRAEVSSDIAVPGY